MASITAAGMKIFSGQAPVGVRANPDEDEVDRAAWEFFPALREANLPHGFSLRASAEHPPPVRALGIDSDSIVEAEQPHGNAIAFVDNPKLRFYPGVDGLLTACRSVTLKIRVADCAAVYLFDPEIPAIGLVHSGRRGSGARIVERAIEGFRRRWGSPAERLIVQISPCIRPPHYEVDFAEQIREQALALGVRSLFDCGICTACHLDRYFSYRAEKGKTGRMWAVAMLPPKP
ncbi:Laccase domain protein [Methylacidimicrobium cyclopophantes]|uniref:Laccase domain protein n=1 Tax=Methylacidimicrobium cyclopophantes TaxID=1041766 RepID=A0A5E6MCZ7_9BACT|nr:polyphenol oxidase family protein [Methylacidimicrobium cyclopophantes]VVM05661.1 Laccase domain protein [Methylacidimicrobium cyclopophantes]